MPVPNEVGAVYDVGGALIDRVWEENFHYGWWDGPSDATSVADATARFTDMMVARWPPRPATACSTSAAARSRPSSWLAPATTR